MSNLLNYLNLLDTDAAARETHTTDPKAAMTKFGLDDAAQEAILSGDRVAIGKLAGVALKDGLTSFVGCIGGTK